MICEIEFVKQAVNLGKGVNELSFWSSSSSPLYFVTKRKSSKW